MCSPETLQRFLREPNLTSGYHKDIKFSLFRPRILIKHKELQPLRFSMLGKESDLTVPKFDIFSFFVFSFLKAEIFIQMIGVDKANQAPFF